MNEELNLLTNCKNLISIFSDEETKMLYQFLDIDKYASIENSGPYEKKFYLKNFNKFSKINFTFHNNETEFVNLVKKKLLKAESGNFFVIFDSPVMDDKTYAQFLESFFNINPNVKLFFSKRNNETLIFSRYNEIYQNNFIERLNQHNLQHDNIYIIHHTPNLDTDNIKFSMKIAISDIMVNEEFSGCTIYLHLKNTYEALDNLNAQKYRLGFFQSKNSSRSIILKVLKDYSDINYNNKLFFSIEKDVINNEPNHMIQDDIDNPSFKKLKLNLIDNGESDIYLNKPNFTIFRHLNHFAYQLINTKIDLIFESRVPVEDRTNLTQSIEKKRAFTFSEKTLKYLALQKAYIPINFIYYELLIKCGFKTTIKLFDTVDELTSENYLFWLSRIVDKILNCNDVEFEEMYNKIKDDIKYDSELFYNIFYKHSLLTDVYEILETRKAIKKEKNSFKSLRSKLKNT